MKTKCMRYVHLYDTAQLQAWLEDQAARGWYLEDAGGGNTYGILPCFAYFIRGGEAARYRLIPMRTEGGGILRANIPEPDQGMQELYKGLGWQYLCNLRGYYVFSSADSAAPEPFTDADTACEALESVVRMTRRWLYSYLFSVALFVYAAGLSAGRTDFLFQWPIWSWLLFYLLFTVLVLRRYWTAKQRLDLARQGDLGERSGYRDAWYLRWGDLLLSVMPWLILLGAFAVAWAELIGSHHIYRP